MNPLTHSVVPDLTDEYEILGELGRGGNSIVYHARDRELGRDVAIKIVAPQHFDDAEAMARMAREAKLVAHLSHPNIVALLGVRHLSAGLAMIMQHVPGRTLKRTIQEDGPLPIAVVENILRDIASALDYAHRRHIVHRDLKPENIYLDVECGRAVLADFGIARTTESESTLTLVGTALGTPAYMSPEQIDGLALDWRSDLYSLGLVAHEMLTGQKPWAGCNLYTIIYRQKHDQLPPLTQFRSDIPPYLLHAIEGLLQKDREQRCFEAAEILAILPPPRPTVPVAERSPQPTILADDTPTIRFQHKAIEPVVLEEVAVPKPAFEEYVEPAAIADPPFASSEAQPEEPEEHGAVLSVLDVGAILAQAVSLVTPAGRRGTFVPIKLRRRYVVAAALGLIVLGASGMVAMMRDGSKPQKWQRVPNVSVAASRSVIAHSVISAAHSAPPIQQREYATAAKIVAAPLKTDLIKPTEPPPTPQITLPNVANEVNTGEFSMPDVARNIASVKAANVAAAVPARPAGPELSNRDAVQRAMLYYYPARLREDGVSGTVILSFVIAGDGAVLSARIDSTSGVGALDQAALRVAKVMRFTASLQKDSVRVQLPVRFEVR